MRNQPFWHIAIFCVLAIMLFGCNSLRKLATSRDIDAYLKHSEIFRNEFSGFVLYDPLSGKYLKTKNADLHFTPASNTKILTTYACLTSLPDSIPSFLVQQMADTIRLEPMGDPTFLHTDFPNQPVINRLKNKPIEIHLPDNKLTPFGPGWAWDDYQYSYQTERSWMPIYGNEVRIFNRDTLSVVPAFFEDYISLFVGEKPGSLVYRERKFNLFNIWMEYDTSSFERKIPFDYSDELLARLLSDTTNAPVSFSKAPLSNYTTLYNEALVPALTLMMQRSDNFLSEQLLITAARYSEYNNPDAFRNHLLSKWHLSSPIQWVDGSGLSRYNLFTPRALVEILALIYGQLSWNEITMIFPTGGVSGTLKNWYPGNPPYVFAKTGTLSNNHCLSGYIKTNSGRILIFSFMNNNYLSPVSDLKREMQRVLEAVRDAY